ncbi:MAG: cell division protein FtsL [Rickettsiales bacterium]|jgi:cell division protein FtsL
MPEDNLHNTEHKGEEPVINKKYERKKSSLKRQIVINFSTSVVFLAIFAAISFHHKEVVLQKNSELKTLSLQVDDLKNKSNNIESRINDVKKYKPTWVNADKRKKDFEGVKISSISDTFEKIAILHDADQFSINVSAPKILEKGSFSNKTFDVNLVDIKLSFKSFTDQDAINIIENILDIIPGYAVITDTSIIDNKKKFYSESELVSISKGLTRGSISTTINFHWYFLKYKDSQKPITASDKI